MSIKKHERVSIKQAAVIAAINGWFYGNLLFFTIWTFSLGAIYLSVVVLVRGRQTALTRLRALMSLWGRWVFRLFLYPYITIEYRDYENNHSETHLPAIIVCNHRAFSDGALLAYLPFEVVQVVNEWPFRIPIFGTLARVAEYVPVKALSLEQLTKTVAGLLRRQISVVAYPEGTRSNSRNMGHFHSAFFRIAAQTQSPLVPVCIMGNEQIPPKGSMLIRPGRIMIHKLPAIPWESYRSLNPYQLKNKIRHIMREHMDMVEGAPPCINA